jgi:putative transcriptional regulator
MYYHPSLKNHFLVAMPLLKDVRFSYSVIYLCEHTPEGAMGIIINKAHNIILKDIFHNMNIPIKSNNTMNIPILNGGPLQKERGFVLHSPTKKKWQASIRLSPTLAITTSQDILNAIAHHQGPEKAAIALGYAAWEKGQLENEIKENSWLTIPASPMLIFDTPLEKKWESAGDVLGINLNTIFSDICHA